MLAQLKLDEEHVTNTLAVFIRKGIENAGSTTAVIGLSGGVDSALSTYLAVRALGANNVLCIIMPHRDSSPDGVVHSKMIVEQLGIRSEMVDITPMVDAMLKTDENMDRLRLGNVMARQRMIVLYDRSARENGLVVGTGNKTELLLGYTTLFGDSACAINPLGDLYKTQVWNIASWIGVPDEVVRKAPSADLWAGQTDEDELGFSYENVDRLLYFMFDEKRADSELLEFGFTRDFIHRVRSIVQRNSFKRVPPLIGRVDNATAKAEGL